jgi:hypothetical protein
MIKCFIVQNINSDTDDGEFKENKFYVAKISCNSVNNISVLDIKGNWVPFKWRGSLKYTDAFVKYFDIWDVFLIENKKELNKYVPTTKFYE